MEEETLVAFAMFPFPSFDDGIFQRENKKSNKKVDAAYLLKTSHKRTRPVPRSLVRGLSLVNLEYCFITCKCD